MPNYLNPDALVKLASLYARRVRSSEGKRWFNTVVRNWLHEQQDCAVLITQVEDEGSLPRWAAQAMQEGRPVHVFHVTGRIVEELDSAVRWVCSLEDVRATHDPAQLTREANGHLRSLQRTGFPQALKNAECWFEKLQECQNDYDRENRQVFPNREIPSLSRRTWRRITTRSR